MSFDNLKEEELIKQNNDLKISNQCLRDRLAETLTEKDKIQKELDKWKNCYGVSEDALAESEEYTEQLENKLHKIKEICNYNDELEPGFNLVDCDKYKLAKHRLSEKVLSIIEEKENN